MAWRESGLRSHLLVTKMIEVKFLVPGKCKLGSKTIKRRWKNKYPFFYQILFRALKSFANKAAVVRDDTPERSFQGWIGRRHE